MSEIIAELNRSTISLSSEYFRFMMQLEADGAGSIIDSSPDAVLGATVALGGTTTNCLDPLTGVLTFHTSGNPYVVNTTNTAVANWLSMAQNSAGGYLVMFQYKATVGKPSATQYLFSAGHHAAANGGFLVSFDTNGKIVATVRNLSGASSKNVVSATDVCTDLAKHTVAVYFDCANYKTGIFVDGADSSSGYQAWGFTDRPTITADRNFGLFGRATSATASTDLIGSKGAGDTLSNLWFVRAETDIHSQIVAIAAEFDNNPSKLLWSLDGL